MIAHYAHYLDNDAAYLQSSAGDWPFLYAMDKDRHEAYNTVKIYPDEAPLRNPAHGVAQ